MNTTLCSFARLDLATYAIVETRVWLATPPQYEHLIVTYTKAQCIGQFHVTPQPLPTVGPRLEAADSSCIGVLLLGYTSKQSGGCKQLRSVYTRANEVNTTIDTEQVLIGHGVTQK